MNLRESQKVKKSLWDSNWEPKKSGLRRTPQNRASGAHQKNRASGAHQKIGPPAPTDFVLRFCLGDFQVRRNVIVSNPFYLLEHIKWGGRGKASWDKCLWHTFYFNTNECVLSHRVNNVQNYHHLHVILQGHHHLVQHSFQAPPHEDVEGLAEVHNARIRIKSCYIIVPILLWNLSNNHPFLGDSMMFQVQQMCDLLSVSVLIIKPVITFRWFSPLTCLFVRCCAPSSFKFRRPSFPRP
jgi:hypothetical protein